MNGFLAALLSLALAAPAAALDWSNVDPAAFSASALKALPGPAAVAGKPAPPPDFLKSKGRKDMERWSAVMEAVRNGEAVSREDVDWARANIERMVRKMNFRKDIRKDAERTNAQLPKDERMSRKELREAVAVSTTATESVVILVCHMILDFAKIK